MTRRSREFNHYRLSKRWMVLQRGVHKPRPPHDRLAEAVVDVTETVQSGSPHLHDGPERGATNRLAAPRLISDPLWRRVGDQDIRIRGNLVPFSGERFRGEVVGVAGKLRDPWRPIETQTLDDHGLIFEGLCVVEGRDARLCAKLDREVVVAANTEDVWEPLLAKPGVDFIDLVVPISPTAEDIAAVDQDIPAQPAQLGEAAVCIAQNHHLHCRDGITRTVER